MLDRTAAWVSTVVGIVLVTLVLSFAANFWHAQDVESQMAREGYCRAYVQNVGAVYEKCK